MSQIKKILIPDIGGAAHVIVIAVLVTPGQTVSVDDPLITLEGDKASMDVPSPDVGVIESISIKVGDKVSEGSLICTIKTTETQRVTPPSHDAEVARLRAAAPSFAERAASVSERPIAILHDAHASPAVRRLAYEVGVDLNKIKGTGEKGRITKEDLKKYVTGKIHQAESGISFSPRPVIDFSKFGNIETRALSKIKKSAGVNLHRNWVSIPHVTQFAEADITQLENFRKAHADQAQQKGFKLTPIVFVMKAVVQALKEFPIFNASLDESSENIILKKYFHIGVAVDTPNGLVVPVIKNVDQKDILDLAKELSDISEKARTTGLSIADMQGGCFTISSLGGIGGAAFTPIVNAPEVAILGLSKSQLKPHYLPDGTLSSRLMLPLSLSYDHRVIDGADGARFIVYLAQYLEQSRSA